MVFLSLKLYRRELTIKIKLKLPLLSLNVHNVCFVFLYCMSKNSCPILYRKSVYNMRQDYLDMIYKSYQIDIFLLRLLWMNSLHYSNIPLNKARIFPFRVASKWIIRLRIFETLSCNHFFKSNATKLSNMVQMRDLKKLYFFYQNMQIYIIQIIILMKGQYFKFSLQFARFKVTNICVYQNIKMCIIWRWTLVKSEHVEFILHFAQIKATITIITGKLV